MWIFKTHVFKLSFLKRVLLKVLMTKMKTQLTKFIIPPKIRSSESRFSEQKPAPLIFHTIHSLGFVNRKLAEDSLEKFRSQSEIKKLETNLMQTNASR